MNLFPLDQCDAGMVLRGTDGPALAPMTAGELLGGIRPESFRLAERGLPVRVRHAEYLGADTVVACAAGEVTLLARLPGRVALAEDTLVHLTTDEPVHLFDAATGRRSDSIVASREIVTA
jgi:sn-glycerol 3-phosphate transport system ATP-binding protein